MRGMRFRRGLVGVLVLAVSVVGARTALAHGHVGAVPSVRGDKVFPTVIGSQICNTPTVADPNHCQVSVPGGPAVWRGTPRFCVGAPLMLWVHVQATDGAGADVGQVVATIAGESYYGTRVGSETTIPLPRTLAAGTYPIHLAYSGGSYVLGETITFLPSSAEETLIVGCPLTLKQLPSAKEPRDRPRAVRRARGTSPRSPSGASGLKPERGRSRVVRANLTSRHPTADCRRRDRSFRGPAPRQNRELGRGVNLALQGQCRER